MRFMRMRRQSLKKLFRALSGRVEMNVSEDADEGGATVLQVVIMTKLLQAINVHITRHVFLEGRVV